MKIRLTCRQKDGDLVTTTSTVLDGKQLAEYFLREGLEINRKFVRVEYYDEYEEVTRTMPMPCDPGDILWVRETWNYGEGEYRYKADDVMPDGWHTTAWRPSIHMPKEAARIFLRVKDVRAERLQEITAAECLREGIEPEAKNHVGQEFAQGMFHDLWDSTVKPADRDIYGWAANPWVWVIEFELCEKPEGWEG